MPRFAPLPFLLASCLATSLALTPACLKQHGDTTADEDEGKDFTVGRFAFRRLSEAEEAVAKKDYEKAKKALEQMKESDDLNKHEQALMWQMYGNIYAAEENYPAAVEALQRCYDLDMLPSTSQRTVEFNLGQLYVMTGKYKKAIALLEAWLKQSKGEPSPQLRLMLANAYVQVKDYKGALPHAEALFKDAKVADESLLQLMLAIRFELEQYDKVVEILTELVERFPKKEYWLQLSAAHGQLKDHRRALAVLELANRQGLLEKESELVMLAQSYLSQELPLQAAELLDKEMEAGRVEPSQKNLELLANAWMAAREGDKALKVLEQAAKKAQTGEPFMRLGQLQMQQERWAQALSALQRALKKGKLKNEGKAHLLLGNANYELGNRAAARQAFQRAMKDEKSRAGASRFLEVMQREDETCPTGKEAACGLIPGRGASAKK